MKTKLFLCIAFFASIVMCAQSTINITTSGGSYATEKWVSITTGVDGSGTQVWGQGDGTYGNGQGLINQDVSIAPGTYYVNCYDRYSDGWDGTLISVTAYGAVIGDNGGVSPSDPSTVDSTGSWETPADELEASFQIIVPMPPSCTLPVGISNASVTSTSADFSWTDSSTEDDGYNWEVVPAGNGQGVGVVVSGTTGANAIMVSVSGLSANTDYDFYVQSNCGASTSSWSSATNFFTGYCASQPSSNDGQGIGQVDLAGTVFSSGGDLTYEDFTATAVSVDNSVSMSVEFQTGYTYDTNIWIDFNNDLVYDSSEIVFDGVSTSANPTTLDTSFNIPGTVIAGIYGMRVGTADSGQSTPNPCYNGSYGVTIDMRINFTPASCINVSGIALDSATSDSITIGWTENNLPALMDWEVRVLPAGSPAPMVGSVNTTMNPYTENGLSSSTAYDVYVRTECATDFVSLLNIFTSPDYCAGDLATDSGGEMGDYGNNENITYTICPDNPGDSVVVTFSEFSFENNSFSGSCYDGLTIYDGDVATGTIVPPATGTIWCWDRNDATPAGTGDLLGVSIAGTTASGCITIVLTSDSSATRDGFTANVSCESTVYMWDGTAWSNTPEGSITTSDNMYVNGTGAFLTNAVSAENVYVSPGASLEASSGDVTIMGDLVNNGDITGSDEIIISGSASTLSGTGSMSNLTVGTAGFVTATDSQSITGTLDVGPAGILDAGGAITLVSNAMGTARVDAVEPGSILGDVNVERYIPATNRSFRFLGSSVTGPTVFDSWQEAGANAAGFGIQVTGVVGIVGNNDAATGLDETLTGNPSMFSWNEAGQSWDAVTNTTTEVLNAGDFYRVFVRGDRMTDLSSNTSAATATTLRATGSLLTGPYAVSPSAASGEFFAVANPYQSKLDMGAVAPANVATDMYYWDPSIGPNGDYSNINIATGTGTVGSATNVLDPGQAVFFASTGSSSVNIDEADKVGGTMNAAVFSTPTMNQMLRVKLYQTSRYQNNQTESDGMYIHFDNTFNDAVTSNDAIKWDGLNTNISIDKATGDKLSVERRTLPTANESVPLHISNHLVTDYTMTVELDMLPGLDVFVKDNLTNTLTPVANNGITAVNFLVDANDAASIDPNRFEIVFQMVTLGLNDENLLSQVRLYPNPVTGDQIQLDLGSIDTTSDIGVTIYNTLGQQVKSYQYDSGVSNTITINNLNSLSSGVYILSLSMDDTTVTRRFIKK